MAPPDAAPSPRLDPSESAVCGVNEKCNKMMESNKKIGTYLYFEEKIVGRAVHKLDWYKKWIITATILTFLYIKRVSCKCSSQY